MQCLWFRQSPDDLWCVVDHYSFAAPAACGDPAVWSLCDAATSKAAHGIDVVCIVPSHQMCAECVKRFHQPKGE